MEVDKIKIGNRTIRVGSDPSGAQIDRIRVLNNVDLQSIHVNRPQTVLVAEYKDEQEPAVYEDMPSMTTVAEANDWAERTAVLLHGPYFDSFTKTWLMLEHPKGWSWFLYSRVQSHVVHADRSIEIRFPEADVVVSGPDLQDLSGTLPNLLLRDQPVRTRRVWKCESYERKWKKGPGRS